MEIKDKGRNNPAGTLISPYRQHPVCSGGSLFAEPVRSSWSLCLTSFTLFSFYTAERFL